MKILRLTLHNFGIYSGTNTLQLMSDKPVTLIGGMNGRGKTTILEAVLLALYGKRSFAIAESKTAFPKYLSDLVNRADSTLEAYTELEFELPADEGTEHYVVKREWNTLKKVPVLNTLVHRNGIYDGFLSDSWDVFIEETLPSAIAPFFFFDGEKISELAYSEDDSQIKESIKALLGIDIVDQAIQDVLKVIVKYKKSVKEDVRVKVLNELEKQVLFAKTESEDARKTLEELTVKKGNIERKLQRAKDLFLTKGGNLAFSKQSIMNEYEEIENKLEAIDEKLFEFVSSDMPLMMVIPLLSNIKEQADKEVELKGINNALEKLPELYDSFSKTQANNIQIDEFINFIRNNTTNVQQIYNLSDSGYYKLKELIQSLSIKSTNTVKHLINERTQLIKRKGEIENYLSVNVDEQQTGKIYKDVLKYTSQLATLEEQCRVAEIVSVEKRINHTKVEREYRKMVESAINELDGAEDTKRIVKYAGYSIEVLEAYKNKLQQAKTSDLASIMTECFLKIATKQNLIGKIEIDPETLAFSYYDDKGNDVTRSSFSAGEKQLLVIAMLWALGICADKQLPVIIDTPLARLDSAHRETLIKNYFPYASNQTILLSTDSEVFGSHYDLLKPFVGCEYTLEYNDIDKNSTVVRGYFGRN